MMPDKKKTKKQKIKRNKAKQKQTQKTNAQETFTVLLFWSKVHKEMCKEIKQIKINSYQQVLKLTRHAETFILFCPIF